MIQFRRDSYALSLLLHIVMAGEFPYNALHLFGNKKMLQRTVLDLKKEGYITVNGTKENKTIRITTKAFPIIENINKTYLDYYYSITDNHHFRGNGTLKVGSRQSYRRHRLAEIMCCLEALDVDFWPDKKPELTLSERKNNIPSDRKLFYTSKEIKKIDANQKYKTEFTRIMGLIFSPGGIYCVYHTNKKRMKWNSQGEGKVQVLVDDIIKMNCSKYVEPNKAIMFTKDINIIDDILMLKAGEKDENNFELLNFDNTYDNIYIVPVDLGKDLGGLIQLKILMSENDRNIIKQKFLSQEEINFQYSTVDCDAITKDGHFKLMFFDGDIGRLKRFKQAMFDKNPSDFEVLCFSWQKEALRKYLPAEVTLIEYPTQEIVSILKSQGGDNDG